MLATFAPGPDSSSPNQHTWDQSLFELAEVIDDVRDNESVSWLAAEREHRRGRYPFISIGGTHGNGRLVSCLLYSFPYLLIDLSIRRGREI